MVEDRSGYGYSGYGSGFGLRSGSGPDNDLFAASGMSRAPAPRKALRVSDVNNYIKSIIAYDSNLSGIYVEGEISNFKRYSSGHAYFSLKDAGSVLKCVMFANQYRKLAFAPSDGMKVIAFGSVNVYERDGVYQLYVDSLQADGLGALFEKFEALKKKLYSEGLFDEEHKKEIPYLPRAVAAITSPSGAVIQDIRNVTMRRFPGMKVILYPSAVQGADAPGELIAALKKAQADGLADVIIIGRGGGSIEDLWAFNDEKLAREIYACDIPVISAVGHETDFTICDYVSDLRAPTPSAAAELAVPELVSVIYGLDQAENKLVSAARSVTALRAEALKRAEAGLGIRSFERLLEHKGETLERSSGRLDSAVRNRMTVSGLMLNRFESVLNAYSYEKVLKRGFALVKDKNGKVLKSAGELSSSGEGQVVMSDGTVNIRVEE
jgi:exodeoxyribonuclease VII large subunit